MTRLITLDKKRLAFCFLLFAISLLAYKTWEMQSYGIATNRRGKDKENTLAFKNYITVMPLRIHQSIRFECFFC